MKNLLILFIALLALSASVNAEIIINKYTNDFSLTAQDNEQIKLCSCEARMDKLLVQNTGHFETKYYIAVSSNYPHIRILQDEFSLAPGEFKEVLVSIEDSCGLTGTYDYKVTATSSYGRTQTLSRTIRSDLCQTTSLKVTPQEAIAGLCQPAVFAVNITNVGTFPDTFALDFGQYSNIAELNQQALYLAAGQSYTQNVSFRFACTDYGTKTVPITVRAGKSGVGASTERTLTIVNQYNFGMHMPENIQMCAKTTTEVPLELQNSANAPDRIIISTTGASYANVPSDVTLDPLQRKNVTMTLSPTQPGTQTVRISATDLYGGVQKEREITVETLNCYDPQIEVRSNATAQAREITACCGPHELFVNVQNNGDQRQKFRLSLEGPSIFTLEDTSIELDAKQNINIPLHAELPCSENNFSARVTVWPQGQPQINSTTEVFIASQTQRTCQMVQIDDDELHAKASTKSIPVTVTHTGSRGGEYTISVNSSTFTIKERSVSILPGESMQLNIIPATDLYTQEPGRYIVRPTITSTDGIAYNEAIGVELKAPNAWERFCSWFGSFGWNLIGLCGWTIIIVFIILLVLLAALILRYNGTIHIDGLPRNVLNMLKALLVILIVFLLVAMFFLHPPQPQYERNASSSNPLVVEWYQGTNKTLDLYAVDPDENDIISYRASPLRDITVRVQGSKLTLTPDPNFAGEETMQVTAMDSHGAQTTSPEFTLRVIGLKKLTLLERMEQWCSHLLIMEFVMLLLVLFLLVLSIAEKRPPGYSRNVLVVVERPIPRTAKKSVVKKKAVTSAKPASRAIVPIPMRTVAKKPAKTLKAEVVGKQRGTVMREFRGSGQTVNIAVGAPAASPAVIAVPGAKPAEIVYIGSKDGDKVHTPYCMIARRIPKKRRVAFSSKREAMNAKLIPCKMCRPFEGGM